MRIGWSRSYESTVWMCGCPASNGAAGAHRPASRGGTAAPELGVLEERVEPRHGGVDDACPAVENAEAEDEPGPDLERDPQQMHGVEAPPALHLARGCEIGVAVHLRDVLGQALVLDVTQPAREPHRGTMHQDVLVHGQQLEPGGIPARQPEHPIGSG